MAGQTLSITLRERLRFKAPTFTAADRDAIAAFALNRIFTRVAAYTNVYDQAAKPYSPRGPIYVPITGVGTFRRIPAAFRGVDGIIRNEFFPSVKRTKTNLGGREVFTRRDLTVLKRRGVLSGPTPLGSITPSGKSIKFANYAAYKAALGKSGHRDLELSGRMLGALQIISRTDRTITIGFVREGERQKAEWNQARDPWFGLSPADRAAVIQYARSLVSNLSIIER